ncbi:MAG TPA: sulfatase-like hydrolase/transferase [Acidimicrobiales bacterium]
MAAPPPDLVLDARRHPLRTELLAALEVGGLTSVAVTRPVLDSFGRSPEVFLARGADRADVVLFVLAVALVPVAAVAAVGAVTRLAGIAVRRWVHLGAVGLLGGLAAWRLAGDVASPSTAALVAVAVTVGPALVALRRLVRPVGTFLRFAGAASVVFLGQFLLLAPSSSLVTGDSGAAADPAATRAVIDGTGGDPPPLVMVVVDALATTTLLDGAGQIDDDLYPNLAGLARDAVWYRNHTTTSAWTYQALPAMLSARLPTDPLALPDATNYPQNLFTMFAGTHDIESVEQMTRLCSDELCAAQGGNPVRSLLGDAVDWWRGAFEERRPEQAQILPGALEPDRGDDFRRWVDDQDFTPGGRPGLWFYHLMMPHEPWDVLDDLSPYAVVEDPPYGLFLNSWGELGAEVALQRQVLQTQAVDALVGHLLDRLRSAAAYEDTLVVVAGDHGEAFVPDGPRRGLTAEQYEQIAWTPLLVKPPGEARGRVDDTNVWNTDLVPTLADMLGIDLPWEVDGIPASQAGRLRDPGDKRLLDSEFHVLEPADGGEFVPIDGREGLRRVLAADPVPGRGERAVWQRTAHGGLVGRDVGDLTVADDRGATVTIEALDRIERPGDSSPVLEVVGRSPLDAGDVVALAVNDVVAAVAPVVPQPPGRGGAGVVHALLLPDPVRDVNDIDAYLVDGRPGDETLRQLTVRG